MVKQFLGVMLVAGMLSLTSCGSEAKNPAEYNNAIITVINGNETHISEMNSAMSSGDYSKAEQVRADWEIALDADIKKVEGLGDFNGDDNFRKSVLEGLNGYKKIVKETYPKLIEIRKNKQNDPSKENDLLDQINTAFENAANKVNEASGAFEAKYNK